jgi:2-amino-4-hydroxy-6-hydroxymethyldihydropteridine diphosphokinase
LENEIYILLGTNLGNKKQNLKAAIKSLKTELGEVICQSKIYETAPWGIIDQPSFLNQVLLVKTKLRPHKALETLLQIEINMGRKRIQKWGARLIDLDILYFGNEIIYEENLVVPHPFLQDRRFTLVPLAEIAPNYLHPILQKTQTQLLAACNDNSEVFLIAN